MSLWSKVNELSRAQANAAFRNLTQNNLQSANEPVLGKVIAVEGTTYTVLLPSGETKFAYPIGSRSIGVGESCHIVGSSIY